MANNPIRTRTQSTLSLLDDALVEKLTSTPTLRKIRKAGPDSPQIYEAVVWNHEKGKQCRQRLKWKGKDLLVSRGKEIAMEAAIAYSKEQIQLTKRGAIYESKALWETSLDMPIAELFDRYCEAKSTGRNPWSNPEKRKQQNRALFNHFCRFAPQIQTLSHLVFSAHLQKRYEEWTQTQSQLRGGKYKQTSLNQWTNFLHSFLVTLQGLDLLPEEWKIDSAHQYAIGLEKTESKRYIPTKEELIGLANFIETTRITKEDNKALQIRDTHKMAVCAATARFMAYFGGRRDTDLLPLVWDDFITEGLDAAAYPNGGIRLHMDKVKKTHQGRGKRFGTIPLFPEALQALLQLKKLQNPLNGSVRMFPQGLERFGRRLKLWSAMYYTSLGMDGIYTCPHDLRSHAIDRAKEKGLTEDALDLYFGNTARVRSQHYSRLLQGADASLKITPLEDGANHFDEGDEGDDPIQGAFLTA